MSTTQPGKSKPDGSHRVQSFFLKDNQLHVTISPQRDKRVFLECRSQYAASNLDIVFVHALGKDRFDTWTCGHVFWPDYLVNDLPGARVLLFNYDTRFWSEPTCDAIKTAAENLTLVLQKARKGLYDRGPIIWVAHSLGGFIVEAACIQAQNAPLTRQREISDDVFAMLNGGAIFLGTPHKALFSRGWWPILERIYGVAGEHVRSSDGVSTLCDYELQHIDNFLSKFNSVLDGYSMDIVSFYEQNETPGISSPILVTSCQYGKLYTRTPRDTLPGNYFSMCQFQGRLDPRYERLKYCLRTIRDKDMKQYRPHVYIKPAAILPPISEQNIVLAVQDIFSLKSYCGQESQDDNELLPSSVICQFASTIKSRLLKRSLAVLEPYAINNLPSIDEWWPEPSSSDNNFPQKCVLSYFFRNALNSEDTIIQMLYRFLLQFLELIPSLVRHFPTRRVFAPAESRWPEWDAENTVDGNQRVEGSQLDTDPYTTLSKSSSHFTYKDFDVNLFTIKDLVEIFISILHDDQVGEVSLVIDGLDSNSAMAQPHFQYFLSLLDCLRTKTINVFLSHDTTQIQFPNRVIQVNNFPSYLRRIRNSAPGLWERDDHIPRLLYYDFRTHNGLTRAELDAIVEKIRSMRITSDIAVTIADQTFRELRSQRDILRFANYLMDLYLDDKRPEDQKIDSLYEWVFKYMASSLHGTYISLLFLVAAAAQPLTTLEAYCLNTEVRHLASQYRKQTQTESLDQHFSKDIGCQFNFYEHEHEFLGLLKIIDDTLILIDPTLKTFLLRKLSIHNLQFYVDYHLAMHCLESMGNIDEAGEGARHGSDWLGYPMRMKYFGYPLCCWFTHLKAAQLSDQWNYQFSERALYLLKTSWKNTKTRRLLCGFSQVALPPVAELPLSCLLACYDLSKMLDLYYSIGNWRGFPHIALDQRCATVNLGQNTLTILEKHIQANNLNVQHGKSLKSYEYWGRLRQWEKQFFLLGWVFEPMDTGETAERHWDEIRRMLKSPSETMLLESKGYLDRLLLLAVRRCDKEAVTELLKHGADYNYIDQDDTRKPSVLHLAAALGNSQVVRELIDRGSQTYITDAFGMTPIHWAAERGHHGILDLLVPPYGGYDQFGQNPLFLACESASKPTVLALLELGFDINFSDKWHRTPIHVASAAGVVDIVRLLLSKGADANTQDDKGFAPLHLAAFGGWERVVTALLSIEHVDPHMVTEAWQTPLHFACQSPNPSLNVVSALLNHQSNPIAENSKGMSPLCIAVQKGSVAMVELLLKATPYLHDMKKLIEQAGTNDEITQVLLKHQQAHSSEDSMSTYTLLPIRGKVVD